MSLLGAMLQTRKGPKLSKEKLRALQQKRLKKLVDYARKHSPYYREKFASVGENFQLSDLPPTDKQEMMTHFDDFLTDSAVTMADIERFTADLDNVGRMLHGKYLIFKTSGSTGHPAVVLYDQSAIDVSSAIAACRTFARKEDLNAFLRHGKKTAGVFADQGFYLACGMSRYLQLRMPRKKTKITIDVNRPQEEIVQALNAFQPAMLSGYPSNLALLTGAAALNIRPDVVITGGELLTDSFRRQLTDTFRCYVQTHYSCTEGGEVACECACGHLHINEDWILLEAVDRQGKPVRSGEMSYKVLITNLSNYIQPFIRYELTDRVIVHEDKCPCGHSFRWLEIEGRTDDILEFDSGEPIAPMSLYKILEEVKGVRRFQLVQTGPAEAELRLLADQPEQAFAQAKKQLLAFFQSKGIESVQLRFSSQPPQAHPVSGKFKHFYRDF